MQWLLTHQHLLAAVTVINAAMLSASFFALSFQQPVKESKNERT